MPIRYLILALTLRCNLQCRYCYNGTPRNPRDMPESVMAQAISRVAAGSAPFHLQLTGGEPTLVPSLIERAAVLAHQTGRCGGIGIQTNATGLTSEVLKYFKTFKFQVGVSLDGPPAVHQQQRGMAPETFRGLLLLEKAGIPFRVTTVVTQANAAVLDQLVLSLAGLSAVRGIGLDLLVDKGRAKDSEGAEPADRHTLKEGLRRMSATLDAVNARRALPIRLRERDTLKAADAGKSTDFCHACKGESMAVDPHGRIFPCGQTLGDPRFNAGTIRAPRYENLNRLRHRRPPAARCRGCGLEAICPGDCPSRLHYNQLENPARACELYRTLWQPEENKPGSIPEKGDLP